MRSIKEQLAEHAPPVCHICFEGGHVDKDCKEDKRDFDLVGTMAAFIGARLNYVLPECNSGVRGGKLISTIRVDQHKEKFWYARVYCTLADQKMVEDAWVAANGPSGLPLKDDFRQKCFHRDAFHYRKVHTDLMKLVPERLHKRLIRHADYRELLFANRAEMEARIDRFEAEDLENPGVDHLEYYRKRYNVETNAALKEALGRYYEEPSFKTMREIGLNGF